MNSLLAFGQPGTPEIIIIALIIVMLFGAKKLPGLARALGQSLSEFKQGRKEGGLPEDAGGDDKPAEG